MLAAQRHIHIVASYHYLLSLFDDSSVDNSGHHGSFSPAPAYSLYFFYLVCIYEHIIGAFKQLVPEVVFQAVCQNRHFTAVDDLDQFLNMMFFEELTFIYQDTVDLPLLVFPEIKAEDVGVVLDEESFSLHSYPGGYEAYAVSVVD